jgi:LacI family transcriptional regulator
MPRATIKDVAAQAGMSISTVNRALHEPEKLREETLRAVLQAAEIVGFYGVRTIKKTLEVVKPKIRVGILLLQRNRLLYRALDQALTAAAASVQDRDVVIHIEYLDELTAQNVSSGLLALARSSDVLGVVAAEHPLVSSTVEQLADRGIPVFALISQLTARCPVGYIGMDMWKAGRTAGWAIDSMCATAGKIGILVGNHRYRCQEACESGFRSYVREHPRGFEILDALSTFETASIAQDVTDQLLSQHRDLVALYCIGGGVSGALAAVRDSGRARDIIVIGHDLTDHTRTALLDGSLNFLMSHPLQRLAAEAITAMVRTHDGGTDTTPPSIIVPFEILTRENL